MKNQNNKKPVKFKRFHVSIQINSIDKAKLYYKIFNTSTNKLFQNEDLTDASVFVKIKKRLEKQGVDVIGW